METVYWKMIQSVTDPCILSCSTSRNSITPLFQEKLSYSFTNQTQKSQEINKPHWCILNTQWTYCSATYSNSDHHWWYRHYRIYSASSMSTTQTSISFTWYLLSRGCKKYVIIEIIRLCTRVSFDSFYYFILFCYCIVWYYSLRCSLNVPHKTHELFINTLIERALVQ